MQTQTEVNAVLVELQQQIQLLSQRCAGLSAEKATALEQLATANEKIKQQTQPLPASEQ